MKTPATSTPPIQQRIQQRRKGGDRSKRTQLTALALVGVLVLLVAAPGLFLVRTVSESAAEVAHAHDIQNELAILAQRLFDAGAAERNYMLTHDDQILGPFRDATSDVTQSMARLRGLVASDAAQQPAFGALSGTIEKTVGTLNARVEQLRATQDSAGILPSIENINIDSAQTLFRAINARAASAVDLRQQQATRAGLVAAGIIAASGLVGLGLLYVVGSSVRRDAADVELGWQRAEALERDFEVQAQILASEQAERTKHFEQAQIVTQQLNSTMSALERANSASDTERAHVRDTVQQLQRAERRFHMLAETAPLQVWMADPDGLLEFVNPTATDYLGRSHDEVLSEGWLSVMHPDDVSAAVEKWTHSLATGEPYEAQFRLRRHDGAYRWHIGRAVAEFDGPNRVLGWIGCNIDVEDLKSLDALQNRLKRISDNNSRELDQLAHVVANDLKAPLRGVANLSEWIEQDTRDSLSPDARDRMQLLRDRVRRIDALLDGILEYSRADRLRVAPSSINTNQLLAELIQHLSPPALANISVNPNLPAVVSERPPLLLVFGNLIGNAIKHAGRPDVRVEISGSVESDRAHFIIADNGPGIVAAHQERVFGLFQRIPTPEKREGTGLGLAVVKKLVEHRGGRVWIESPTEPATSTGTAVHFTWPLDTGDQ